MSLFRFIIDYHPKIMKTLFFTIITALLFMSCEHALQEKDITENQLIGKWKIVDRIAFDLAVACEKNEYIIFNADSTLVRYQCDTIIGKWSVNAGDVVLELQTSDSTTSSYYCSYLSDTRIRAASGPIWAVYEKDTTYIFP